MNEQLKAVEAEIYPQRKSKRIHIAELQAKWAAYMKTLEKPKKREWLWGCLRSREKNSITGR